MRLAMRFSAAVRAQEYLSWPDKRLTLIAY